MSKRVFISKNASEVLHLQSELASNNHQLLAQSFLKFNPLEFELEEDYDVIFFGSPRAVFFFKSEYDIPASVEIACVGGKTASIIGAINRKVAFNGEQHGSIEDVSEAFKKWCGDKKVLFPISSISLKTVSSKFEKDKKIELEVYETIIQGEIIEDCDILVFTSPSNVRGFLIKNKISPDTKVFAWGESTKKELVKLGVQVDESLASPSEEALISELSPYL